MDILLYGDETIELPECDPHPRMLQRNFVLARWRNCAGAETSVVDGERCGISCGVADASQVKRFADSKRNSPNNCAGNFPLSLCGEAASGAA